MSSEAIAELAIELARALNPGELRIARLAIFKLGASSDLEADVLLQSRTSDASPENRAHNVEICKRAHALRVQAGDCRRLLARLNG